MSREVLLSFQPYWNFFERSGNGEERFKKKKQKKSFQDMLFPNTPQKRNKIKMKETLPMIICSITASANFLKEKLPTKKLQNRINSSFAKTHEANTYVRTIENNYVNAFIPAVNRNKLLHARGLTILSRRNSVSRFVITFPPLPWICGATLGSLYV